MSVGHIFLLKRLLWGHIFPAHVRLKKILADVCLKKKSSERLSENNMFPMNFRRRAVDMPSTGMDDGGLMALHVAAQFGHAPLVELLGSFGATVEDKRGTHSAY